MPITDGPGENANGQARNLTSDNNASFERDQAVQCEDGMWINPGLQYTLALAANDVVQSFRKLSNKIGATLGNITGLNDIELTLFDFSLNPEEQWFASRTHLYKLMVAICCEESLNRFAYFELPATATEVIEKLQATEKLLITAAFLGHSDIKSNHIYEGVKSIFDWRNRFAHGHNPWSSTRSLRANHATLPGKLSDTLQDHLQDLQKTSLGYLNLMGWLLKAGTHPLNKLDWTYKDACRMMQMFSCLDTREQTLTTDDGARHIRFILAVDEAAFARVPRCDFLPLPPGE